MPGKKNKSVNPNYTQKKSGLQPLSYYVDGIVSGNRTILSQAITLIESTHPERKELGGKILDKCLHQTGNSVRIGITGVPGVGKSTFIDTFGKLLINHGKKVAVLTVDPSSNRSKGSILGDKTRMQFLSAYEKAYIRPTPASGTLGGVARKTREAMLLCEAAGYDTIFIETVGVGQSETVVHSMTDFFLLLMIAGAGDELQGIKRGIMEMADLLAINKADGENLQAAKKARLEYENAFSLLPEQPSGWKPPVQTCSALQETGLNEIYDTIQTYFKKVKKSGYFEQNRQRQAVHWMYESIHQQLKEKFYGHPAVQEKLKETENKVIEGELSSFKAASKLINLLDR